MKNTISIALGFLAGLIAVFAIRFFTTEKYVFQGVLIDPPAHAYDFSLTDQNGQVFTLSEQRGKINLIFFGYTNCPDICPTTLAMFQKIKADLGDGANQVNFVMITVDPERDDVARLKSYLAAFDPSFIGLTGDPMTLEHIWHAYGVFVDHSEDAHANNALIDHSSRVYLINQKGEWLLNYPYGMEYEKIVSDIRYLLSENN